MQSITPDSLWRNAIYYLDLPGPNWDYTRDIPPPVYAMRCGTADGLGDAVFIMAGPGGEGEGEIADTDLLLYRPDTLWLS